VNLHDRMLRYFTWLTAGDVDVESPRTGSLGERSVDGVMPGWFLTLCDTGTAIAKLPPRGQAVVNARWRMAVALDDAHRDVLIMSMRGETRSRHARQARVDDLRKGLGRMDRRESYKDSMGVLFRLLGG